MFDQPIEAKKRTGYLPETPPLYPDMTVREYLDFVERIGIAETRRVRGLGANQVAALEREFGGRD